MQWYADLCIRDNKEDGSVNYEHKHKWPLNWCYIIWPVLDFSLSLKDQVSRVWIDTHKYLNQSKIKSKNKKCKLK